MKKLISLALVVALAVLITLAALENTGKVALFLPSYRIDFSLNFAIVGLILLVSVVWFSLSALRASSLMPGRFKRYLTGKKQQALLRANTTGLIALIVGDDQLAEKALRNAKKTGEHNELSYLTRAMSAIQSDRLDVADTILEEGKVWQGEYQDALMILKARVALSKTNYRLALELVQSLPTKCAKYPQVRRIKLLALIGEKQWRSALEQLRLIQSNGGMSSAEADDSAHQIYSGLASEVQTQPEAVAALSDQMNDKEKANPAALAPVADGLLKSGHADKARQVLEIALDHSLDERLLSAYRRVAGVQSQSALPFVEKLLTKHKENLLLLELAAEVCEREQLWGKAIARFEKLYQHDPTASTAGRLQRLYDLANQPEKAARWRDKLHEHLGRPRQLI